MGEVFADDGTDATFRNDGVVVLPLLDADDVARLAAQADGLRRDGEGLDVALSGRTLDDNLAISEAVLAVVAPRVARVLADHRLSGGTFLAKAPGEAGEVTLHQDWALVDEAHHRSMNVWCPLSDVDADEGALQVVRGSHRWATTFRSPAVPSVQVRIDAVPPALLEPVPARAGEAVFYDSALFHASGPNRSPVARVVAQLGALPARAPFTMAFPADGGVELREVPVDAFFTGLDAVAAPPTERPGTAVRRVAWTPLSPDDLLDLLRRRAAGLT